jgi:hypothetical protein
MSVGDLSKALALDLRYGPPLFGVLLFGVAVLVFKDLSDPVRRYLVPSLAVYTLGAEFISYIHIILGRRKAIQCQAAKAQFGGLHWGWMTFNFVGHCAWLAAFIVYNFWRDTL